jgi:hypothetical protein
MNKRKEIIKYTKNVKHLMEEPNNNILGTKKEHQRTSRNKTIRILFSQISLIERTNSYIYGNNVQILLMEGTHIIYLRTKNHHKRSRNKIIVELIF